MRSEARERGYASSHSGRWPRVGRGQWVVCCLLVALVGCGGGQVKDKVDTKAANQPPPIPWGERPQVAAFEARQFPSPTESLLARSGVAKSPMKLWVVERHESEAVYFRWVMPGGSGLERSAGLPPGTTGLMANLMTEGSKRYRGAKFDAALQAIGGQLEVYVTADATVVAGRCLRDQFPALMKLTREALFEPEFGRRAFDTLITRQRARLVSWLSRPRSIAGRVLNQLLYGAKHPYGSPGLTLKSLPKVRIRHLKKAQQQLVGLANSVFVAAGDITPGDLQKSLRQTFGSDFKRRPSAPPTGAQPQVSKPGCYVVDVPKAVQTVVMTGNPGPKRSIANWATLKLANQILGGSASSRLFTELRERKGLTYGVYSNFDGRRWAGDWSVSTSVATAKTAAALDAIRDQITQMQKAAPTKTELSDAIRYMTGQYANNQATSSGVVASLASLHAYDLPKDRLKNWIRDLQASSGEQLRVAAKKWMGTKDSVVVIVGNLKPIRPQLDVRCDRLIELSQDGQVARHLIASDAEMSNDERGALFTLWAGEQATLPALKRFLLNPERKDMFRASALNALVDGIHAKLGPSVVGNVPRWPSVATKLADLLVDRLLHDKNAGVARRWLLDLLAPQSGESVIPAADHKRLNQALVQWIFTGVGPEGDKKVTLKLISERIGEGDVCRLGAQAISGLESLVSVDVWRETASECLAKMDSKGARTALLRAYRRLLVQRKAAPTDEDLSRIGHEPSLDAALLLLDNHGLLRLQRPLKDAADDADRVMGTIQSVLSALGAQPASDGSRLSEVFPQLIHHIEALLASPDANDRWWAADLLIEHRGLPGLRLVLSGLKDDDAYSRPRPDMNRPGETERRRDVYRDLNQIVATRIRRLPDAKVRPILTAALAGKSRIAEVVAIATLRSMDDPATLTILRTHRDEADVSKVLRSRQKMTLTRFARCAAAVRQARAEIAARVKADELSKAQANVLVRITNGFWELSGHALKTAIERATPRKRSKKRSKRSQRSKGSKR